jgi:hypothetical protein
MPERVFSRAIEAAGGVSSFSAPGQLVLEAELTLLGPAAPGLEQHSTVVGLHSRTPPRALWRDSYVCFDSPWLTRGLLQIQSSRHSPGRQRALQRRWLRGRDAVPVVAHGPPGLSQACCSPVTPLQMFPCLQLDAPLVALECNAGPHLLAITRSATVWLSLG